MSNQDMNFNIYVQAVFIRFLGEILISVVCKEGPVIGVDTPLKDTPSQVNVCTVPLCLIKAPLGNTVGNTIKPSSPRVYP